MKDVPACLLQQGFLKGAVCERRRWSSRHKFSLSSGRASEMFSAAPICSPVFILCACCSHLRRALTLYVWRCSLFLRHERMEKGSNGRQGASFPPQSILRSLFSGAKQGQPRGAVPAAWRLGWSHAWVGAVGGAGWGGLGLHPCMTRVL